MMEAEPRRREEEKAKREEVWEVEPPDFSQLLRRLARDAKYKASKRL